MRDSRPIAFLFPTFPNLHQTFVLWEVLGLRQRGIPLALYSIRRPLTRTQQPEAHALASEVTYLPSALAPAVWGANAAAVARAPWRYARVWAGVVRGWWADRGAERAFQRAATAGHAPERELSAAESLRGAFDRSPFLYLLKSLWLVPVAIWLGRELQRRGVRHVHAHWASYPATVALAIHWFYGLRFSFTAHAYDIYLVPRLLGVKLREAAFVVTCARANAEVLGAIGGPSAAERIVVNYHGVDCRRFQPSAARGGGSPPCVVTCGRLEAYKGHHVLLQAIARVPFPVRCIVVGEGPQRARLEQLARTLGIADHVAFTGPVAQRRLVEIYRGADVFALASVVLERFGKRDVIPNALVEAMAMEVPVVATRLAGIPELIADGVDGRLVAPNDAAALAAVLAELLLDEPQRRRLAAGGGATVRRAFDRNANIEALVALFRGAAAAEPDDRQR